MLQHRENRRRPKGAGIELFQIVLGLMCPGRLSGGGESQNEAKSRRFGMDMPCRAFYEGVNPKTILNNCHQLCFNRHRRRYRGVLQPKSALCHLPEGLADTFGSLVPAARVPCGLFRKPCAKTFGERCALQGPPEGVVSPNAEKSASLVTNVPCRPL